MGVQGGAPGSALTRHVSDLHCSGPLGSGPARPPRRGSLRTRVRCQPRCRHGFWSQCPPPRGVQVVRWLLPHAPLMESSECTKHPGGSG